jgi:CBS domain-containing protein
MIGISDRCLDPRVGSRRWQHLCFDQERSATGNMPRTGEVHPRQEVTMTVKAILSRKGSDVATSEPHAKLEDAMRILAERRIGALVITGADQRIVGILSERDIVRTLAQRGPAALEQPLAEVMTRKVVTCGQSETVSEIMERMTIGKFRHVPVVEQGRLIGIISIGDVVKSRLEEMEREQAALHDYIRTA